jgi:hypothetical protein
MFGWLRRYIFMYVYSTPGLAEQEAAATIGAEQAESDERAEERSEQRRAAAEGEE